jgi:hypothetical protein
MNDDTQQLFYSYEQTRNNDPHKARLTTEALMGICVPVDYEKSVKWQLRMRE